MNNLLGVYLMSPHVRAVLDRKAMMFSNARLYVCDKDGNEVENHDVIKLLRNPNPLQTQESYMAMYSLYRDIYAQTFEYKYKAELRFNPLPRVIWNLPPQYMKLIPTGKLWDQTTVEGIIEKYVMDNGGERGQFREFATNSIIHTTQGISSKFIVGESKLLTLEKPINNLIGSARTRNAIIFDRGMLGILSNQSKDSAGGIPLRADEKPMLEKQMRADYGIQEGQMRTLITNASLTYQPMTFPTKDLMLFEGEEIDFQAICQEYGMARDLFPSTKGATYENQAQAEKGTYQNTIQPEADSWCRSIEQDPDFKSSFKPGQTLKASFEHLPIMKEDKAKAAGAMKTHTDAVVALVNANVINPAQAQAIVQVLTGIQVDASLETNNKLLSGLAAMSPLVANNLLQVSTINEAREAIGLPRVPDGDKLISVQPVAPTVNT